MGSKVAWVVVAWVVLQGGGGVGAGGGVAGVGGGVAGVALLEWVEAWAVVWVVSRADAVTTTRFQLKLQL